jgi:long-chain fatty acid transport protein
MVWQGASYDIGAAIFSPRRSYHATGTPSAPPGTPCGINCPFSIGDGDQKIDSENEAFLIPQFGYNWAISPERTIGVSVFGNGGMNTEYEGGEATLYPTGAAGGPVTRPGTYGDGTAGVNLEQLFVSTTYAAKISDSSSWGISAIVAYQRFAATGMSNFGGFSNSPDKLSNNGTDTSYGLGIRLGFQAEVAPGIRIGAAYQPKIDMTEFDDYSGLFAEDGDFDIPSNYTLGLAVDVGSSGVLLLDYQGINYEDVAAVSNPIAPLTDGSCGPTDSSGCLGGKDVAGFGWEDIQIIKLGYQWQTGKNTWRLGYSHTNQPIPSSEVVFNILAPGVMEDHFTFGYARDLNAKSSISFAAMYAPSNSVKGENTFDPNQDIELEMDQYELAIAYNRRL